MTIWTVRNEKIEGYFYSIHPSSGNCIFQCSKSTLSGTKIMKRRFNFTDIVFMAQQNEDN